MPKNQLRLIVIRHGETEKNRLRIVQGQSDGELTSAGLNDVRKLSETLKNESISAAYSSDLGRAMATTDILVAEREIPIISEPRLREQSYGIFEGKKLFGMLRRMKHEGTDFTCFNPPEGEKSDIFKQRIKQFLDEITVKHTGDNVLLVTHYGVIRVIVEDIFRLKLDSVSQNDYYSNCSAITLAIDSDGKTAFDRLLRSGSHNG